jgi:type I restriction enzyme M protein
MVDKGWNSDLVPKELVINRFFETEKTEIGHLNLDLETTVSQYQELEEEYGSEEAALYEVSKKTDAVANLDEFTDLALSKYFPELHKEQNMLIESLDEETNLLIEQNRNAVFDNLKNAKGVVTKTTVQKAYKGMDEDSENTKILKSWLDTNDAVATIKKEAKALTGSIEQSIQSKIEEDKTLDHIYELTIVNQYIQLRDAESKLKKQIKEKEQELDDTLYAKYPELTEEEIKLLVVNDK